MKRVTKDIMKKEIKGLSPVIATVLLVTIVIIIALIVFLWIRGMTQEAITKFGDRNIELVCSDVQFEASYSDIDGLYVANFGNVPLFGMDAKEVGDGKHTTVDLRDYGWPETGLNTGGIFLSDPEFSTDLTLYGAKEIVLVPVLLGMSNSGKKSYVCNEKQHGYPLYL